MLAGAWVVLTAIVFTASAEPFVFLGLPLYFAALIVSVLIHEAGHAVAALLVGSRVVVFSVWRLAIHVHNRQLAILPAEDLEEQSGWVLAVPRGPRTNTRRRRAAVVAGGPAANMLQALLACAYGANAAPGATLLGANVQPLSLGFLLLGAGMALYSLVPHSRGEKQNDGRILLDLLGPGGMVPHPGAWAASLLQTKVRLRDVPEWMLGGPDIPDFDYGKWRATIEIGRTLDRSPVDVPRARSLIDRFWKQYEPDDWLRSCDAYLAAANERDLERANALIGQLSEPSVIPQMAAAAQAAACKLAGDEQQAAEWLDFMDEAIAGTSPFRDLTFAEIRARIEAIRPLDRESSGSLRASAESA